MEDTEIFCLTKCLSREGADAGIFPEFSEEKTSEEYQTPLGNSQTHERQ